MRLVNINNVQEGAILARPVRNSRGRILLGEGVSLAQGYLEKLKYLGYDMLFVQDPRFEDVQINNAISDKTKEIAYQSIRMVTSTLEDDQSQQIDAEPVRFAIHNIIQDLLYSYDVLSNLTDIMGYDEYTYHHSINTTVLALMIAMGKGYNPNKLLELGMGVLMHDIGKTKIDKDVVSAAA